MNFYIIILLEFTLVSSSILLLFKYRNKIGLAPLYLFLGAIQYFQILFGTLSSFKVLNSITIYPGSVIIFSATLFAVLLIYIKEGVKSTRRLIIGIIISNILLTTLFNITSKLEYLLRGEVLPVLVINYKYFITGTILFILDFILLVVLYQYLIKKTKRFYFLLVIFISLFTALLFDGLAFNLILKSNTADFYPSLMGHLIGKTISAFVFSLILFLYLKYIDVDNYRTNFISGKHRDVFSIINYRARQDDSNYEKTLANQLVDTLNNITDGFISLDKKWCYTYLNNKAAQYVNKDPENLIGQSIWKHFPEDEASIFYKYYKKAVKTRETQHFKAFYAPLNKWFENRVYPTSTGLTIYFTDITNKKEQEDNNLMLESLIETSDEFIGLATLQGKPIYLNSNGKKLVGIGSNKELPESITKFFPKAYHKVILNEHLPSIFTKNKWNGEAQFQNFKTKELIPIDMSGFLIKDSSTKEPIAMGIVAKDISIRKKAQIELEDTQRRLKAAIRIGKIGYWSWNILNKEMYWSDLMYNIYNVEKDVSLNLPYIINIAHPEDREYIKETINNSIKTKVAKPIEHRLLWQDGTIKFVRVHMEIIEDDHGNVIKFQGTVVDITEKKETEIELINREILYRELTTNVPVGIFKMSMDGSCNYVNKKWIEYSGISFNEAIGFGWVNALHPDDKNRIINSWMEAVSLKKDFYTDLRFVKSNGSIKEISVNIVKTYDANNKLYGYIGMCLDITKRKQAEEKLIKSEKLFRELSSKAPVAIFQTDAKGACNYVNQEWMDYTGYTFDEAMGYGWVDVVYHEDKNRVIKDWKHAIATKSEFISEFRFRNKKGDIFWSSSKSVRTYDINNNFSGYIGITLDITSQKNAEKIEKENKQYLLNIINTIGDPVFVKNEESKLILVNDALCSIFNLKREDILGKTLASKVPLKERNTFLDIDKKVLETGVENINEETVSINNQAVRTLSVKKNRYIDSNNNKYLVGVIRDITSRKQAEVELQNHKDNLESLVKIRTIELEKEKEKAQSADFMKSAFLATMSHELRTPMNSIIGFTGILLKELAGPLNQEQKKQLYMVKNSATNLLNLLNDVLDISKIEAGKLKVSYFPFNYLDSLEKIIDSLLPQAARKGLKINSEISSLEINLVSDERRVEQIILNLLSNAIKFSSKGVITVKVKIINQIVVTQVIDQGIGIDKENISKLFKPFVQLESGLNRKHEGTGLGLSICKNLVEILGGTIHVESELGKGSTFTFKLPLNHVT
ncbi:PAS domain S-box protein [Lacinutrix sp. MedPE-SW]|uniref:PAS domain-containing protein n=1 Tax=Lacinutrix sp. MedPE-SW TaxID=1860087 RepID=UPI00092250C0|nr:PAS domain S-box protein [Lacinutrix sp. MedPE-SW]OIQ22283.1 MAG: hypothetical protein BM549_07245 [Lacinutrix sp. MedPE-SW]